MFSVFLKILVRLVNFHYVFIKFFLKMSANIPPNKSFSVFPSTTDIVPEHVAVANDAIDNLLSITFDQITHKADRSESVAFYFDILKQALEVIAEVYDKSKPSNNHSHVIEAWNRDKAAMLSAPDSLIENLL